MPAVVAPLISATYFPLIVLAAPDKTIMLVEALPGEISLVVGAKEVVLGVIAPVPLNVPLFVKKHLR